VFLEGNLKVRLLSKSCLPVSDVILDLLDVFYRFVVQIHKSCGVDRLQIHSVQHLLLLLRDVISSEHS